MDNDEAKLFVGGLSWETKEDSLIEHFNKYGTVVAAVVAKDRNTGFSRGFGFVSFSEASSALQALQDTHVIVGRTVDVKKAIPRGEQNQQHQTGGLSFRTKKIFVGGLSSSLTEEEFKNYFEKFGKITDVVVMHDNTTNRPRGFGFITFDSEESVEEVIQESFYELSGKRVEVKKAVPKDYNMRTNAKRGYFSSFNSYPRGSFLPSMPYNPRYGGVYPGYAPGYVAPRYFYGANVYGGGYPMGGYWGYSPSPSPWNGTGLTGGVMRDMVDSGKLIEG